MNLIFLIVNIILLLINIILFFLIKKEGDDAAIQMDSCNLPLNTIIIDAIFDQVKICGTSLHLYGGLIGKIVKREGKEYLVLSCDVIPGLRSAKYRLRLYSPDTKKVRFIVLSDGNRRDADFLKKYGVLNQLPIRSRVIRRDVKNFCNNMCIQDCSDCVLKKYYGKTKDTSK